MDGFALSRDDAIAMFFAQNEEVWDGLPTWEPEELIDGADTVVALIRVVARGKIGGVEIETLVWNVWSFEDGKPVRLTYFGEDRTGAMEAAGVPN